jgi:hypothetical protein
VKDLVPSDLAAASRRAGGTRFAAHAAAGVGFLLLAIAISWPLARHLTTAVPGGGPGDNLTFLWNFWWMRHALASKTADVLQTSFLFYPFGTSLALDTFTPLDAFVGATLLAPLSSRACASRHQPHLERTCHGWPSWPSPRQPPRCRSWPASGTSGRAATTPRKRTNGGARREAWTSPVSSPAIRFTRYGARSSVRCMRRCTSTSSKAWRGWALR